MKKSFSILVATLALSACAPANPNAEQNAIDRERILAQPINPSIRKGIWMDQPTMKEFRATNAVPAEICQQAATAKDLVTKILAFGEKGAVFQYDPYVGMQEENHLFNFEKGKLVPQKGHEKLANDGQRSYDYELHRASAPETLRMHVRATEHATGRTLEEDDFYVRVSEREVRKYVALEYACAGKTLPKPPPEPVAPPVDNATGNGKLTVTDSKGTPHLLKLTADQGRAMSCGFDGDGTTFRVGSGAGDLAQPATYAMDGILVSLPDGADTGGSPVDAKLGGDATLGEPRVEIGIKAQPDSVFEGTCQVAGKVADGKLVYEVACKDVLRTSTKTPGGARVSIAAELVCFHEPKPGKP